MKNVIWVVFNPDLPRRWHFASYSAAAKSVKQTFGIELPPESQVTDQSRLGHQVNGWEWVQIDAIPLYTSPINLK